MRFVFPQALGPQIMQRMLSGSSQWCCDFPLDLRSKFVISIIYYRSYNVLSAMQRAYYNSK